VTGSMQDMFSRSDVVRTFRTSLNTLGDGYIEAIDDNLLIEIARQQPQLSGGAIAGQVIRVPVLEAPGVTRVGRFGWKNQHASLLSFSADAYLNEMGITNTLQPYEVTDLCNTPAQPNDKRGADGLTDIDHFPRFVRATKGPARDLRQAATPAVRKGEALFAKVGCDICHVAALTTAPAGAQINGGKFVIPAALGNKTFHPYGDFLLHDVGTGDGIVVAMPEHYGRRMAQVNWKELSMERYDSGANRIRTAPLWGVRMRPMLMHDG